MNPELICLIGTVFMLSLFAIGMPIAFAMALAGIAGYAYLVSPSAALSLLPRDIFEQISSYPLSVIPMFVLMGCYAFAAGIGKKVFETVRTLFGSITGGLAIATVAASTVFGAISGSTSATCATIGKVSIPEMQRFGYKDWLSTGTVTAVGGLGIMIPPSTSLIVYGILTEQSIGKLFIAGIIPGIVLALLFIGTIYIICKRNPESAPVGPPTTLREKFVSLKGLLDTIILFFVTIGGIFAGWFTPTQAGAIGAAGVLVIGLFNRQLNWSKFVDSTREGLHLSCMILFLIAGATVFGHFITRSGVPRELVNWIGAVDISPTLILIAILIVWFILGFFIDAMALIVLLIPVLLPLIVDLGYDLVWFAIIVTAISMVAVASPPVGVNAYVVKGITEDIPLTTIFGGAIIFLIPLIVGIGLFIAFPSMVTFLTEFMTY